MVAWQDGTVATVIYIRSQKVAKMAYVKARTSKICAKKEEAFSIISSPCIGRGLVTLLTSFMILVGIRTDSSLRYVTLSLEPLVVQDSCRNLLRTNSEHMKNHAMLRRLRRLSWISVLGIRE